MRKQTHWLCAALILSFAALFFAASAMAQEYTSQMEVLQNEELRQDFIIQGEYLTEAGGLDVGLHIIADGGGKFRVVGYIGGLPGDGWRRGDPRILGTASLDGDDITFSITEQRDASPEISDLGRGEVKGKVIVPPRPQGGQGVRQQGAAGARQGGAGAGQFRANLVRIEIPAAGQRPALVFEKQNRRSATLGARAPEGAIVIFDGTNVDKFQPRPEARINEVPVPQRQGGGQQGQGQGAAQRGNFNTLWAEAATTAFEKRPYKLHIEFMLSYMPQARGQARSNSGVYIDERYELQVLDSFGLEGRDNECGGFYQFAGPAVNMCFPPLTWQTYEIDFTPARWDGDRKIANARVSAIHNGVQIHSNLELTNHTPGRRDEGPAPLGIYLQGHGNRVQYRNIWIQYKDWEPLTQAVTLPAEIAPEQAAAVAEVPLQRPQPLFPRVRALFR